MLSAIQSANLAIRFLLELGALAALAFWGYHAGQGVIAKISLGFGAALAAAIVWGLFVAPQASVKLPAPISFVLGLAVLVLAAIALATTGHRTVAASFGAIILLNAALMAAWRQ